MSEPLEEVTPDRASFIEELLGPTVLRSIMGAGFGSWASHWQVAAVVSAFAALLILPYVGAVGLWDPWETHYGEVARMMLVRNDFVRPFWESSWFFSKPPLTMWMDIPGMWLAATNGGAGEVSRGTEWAMRLPFAVMSIATLALFAVALSRTVSRRVGLASAFALATMPLYFLLSRQVVTDTPFICTLIAAMSCALIGLFAEDSRDRAGWWYAFWILLGLGTLAKELLAVALPAGVLMLYAVFCVIRWDAEGIASHERWLFSRAFREEVRAGQKPMPPLFELMFRMRLGTGLLLFLLVAGPWLLAMLVLDPGVDDEHQRFWYRYFVHDQFARLTQGVHTTTPFSNFIYFIEQGGYAVFPWVAVLPGAFVQASRIRLRSLTPESRVGVVAILWALLSFLLLGSSATKFHHYVFPILPPLAILMGLFVDKLWREGVARHAVALMSGFVLFVLVAKDLTTEPVLRDMELPAPLGEKLHGGMKVFTDLFVYNYDRAYPLRLLNEPVMGVAGGRPLTSGDLLTLVFIAVGVFLFFDSFGKLSSLSSRVLGLTLTGLGFAVMISSASKGAAAPTVLVCVVLAVGAGLALFLARRGRSGAGQGLMETAVGLAVFAALAGLAAAVTMLPARALSADPLWTAIGQGMNLRSTLSFAFFLGGLLLVVAAVRQSRLMLFASWTGLTAAFVLWFSWGHWVDLSHHWTQRDLFWRYYAQRKPGEPIAAYLMNWRGETFYSRNTVKQIRDDTKMKEYISLPGRKWSLVEQGPRTQLLKQLAGEHPFNIYEPSLNAKFVLVSID